MIQDVGKNPLDRFIARKGKIADATTGFFENIRGRNARMKHALNLKGRAKDALLSKLQDCKVRGCKGKRGGTCANCGAKII